MPGRMRGKIDTTNSQSFSAIICLKQSKNYLCHQIKMKRIHLIRWNLIIILTQLHLLPNSQQGELKKITVSLVLRKLIRQISSTNTICIVQSLNLLQQEYYKINPQTTKQTLINYSLKQMKSQIERIRKANFSDIEKRVKENNSILDQMQQKFSKSGIVGQSSNRINTELSKHLKNTLRQLKKLKDDIRYESQSAALKILEIAKAMSTRLMQEIRKRDQRIYELKKSLDSFVKTPSAAKLGEKPPFFEIYETETKQHPKPNNFESIKQITHSQTSFTLQNSKKNNSITSPQPLTITLIPLQTQSHLQNFYTNPSDTGLQDLPQPQLDSRIRRMSQNATHKRHPSLQIETNGYGQKGTPVKREQNQEYNSKQLTEKEALIYQFSSVNAEQRNFESGSKGRLIPQNVCLTNFKQITRVSRGDRTQRIGTANKQNGPVLPKPLRKNSIQSQRNPLNNQDQPPAPNLPPLPTITIPFITKAPAQNGFGVFTVNQQEIYRGVWKNGVFDGRGKLKGNGWTYEGEFRNGSAEGSGILAFGRNWKWIGKFVRNLPEGEGCLMGGASTVTGVWKRGQLIRKTNGTLMFV